MRTPLRPASLLLLTTLFACDDAKGRDDHFAPGCADAKCEDPNGDDRQDPSTDPPPACHDGKHMEERLDQCRWRFPDSPLWSKQRPGFDRPDDLLYYVNRWHSIDPCFVDLALGSDPTASLTRAQGDFDLLEQQIAPELQEEFGIESYGLGLAEPPDQGTWRRCTDKDLPTPTLVSIPGGVSIRQDAWESPLPSGWTDAGHPNPDTADGSRIQGFRALFLAATEQGITLTASSGYRNATTQASTFSWWVSEYGRDRAETFSAWPLHSEHQLGTAIDMQISARDEDIRDPINGTNTERLNYANSDALAWIRDNAHRFGVVLSYPVDRVHEHQYVPEPWHFRYVGVEAAALMHECQLSTEELMWGMYGDDLPPMPAFDHMDMVTANVQSVGYDEASCWFPAPSSSG